MLDVISISLESVAAFANYEELVLRFDHLKIIRV
jgi:hypothetical protein